MKKQTYLTPSTEKVVFMGNRDFCEGSQGHPGEFSGGGF
jgi:hypothetical protein